MPGSDSFFAEVYHRFTCPQSCTSSRNNYGVNIIFSRNHHPNTRIFGFSRTSRLRYMSGRLFGSGHGMLLCGRIYLGRNTRCYCSCNCRRLLHSFRELPGCMRSCTLSYDAIEGARTCLCHLFLADSWRSELFSATIIKSSAVCKVTYH